MKLFATSILARKFLALGILATGLSCGGGCKRGIYYQAADRDAYCVLSEKGQGPTWQIQQGFTIKPDSRSRFYDPTCVTDPALRSPAPQLYRYQVPELTTPEPSSRSLRPEPVAAESADPAEAPAEQAANSEIVPDVIDPDRPPVQAAPSILLQPSAQSGARAKAAVRLASATKQTTPSLSSPLLAAILLGDTSSQQELPLPSTEQADAAFSVRLDPIPPDIWNSLPPACSQRMLEFESVREEYERSFGRPVTEEQLDASRRVNLENILELALINNREYQRRKETLYSVALRLSLERFQYDLRFFSRGNGVDTRYTHARSGGVEVNQLRTPSAVGVTKSLYTAGDLAARFANDVVLTFNGANGYSSRVGSELLIDLSQPLIQRDVRFEPLTQAERNVIYAARDYVRYRKQLFRDLTVRYYNLLLTYRNIAIDTQDYFSNLRGFNRADALERVGEIPRFQVDQFEQNALSSRGSLVNSCNALEGDIDRLKLFIGLPTELPLNLDLTELESLTLRDESAVVEEQIRRKLEYVQQQNQRYGAAVAVTAAAELIRRTQNLQALATRQGRGSPEVDQVLRLLLLELEMESKRIEVLDSAQSLNQPEVLAQEGVLYGRTLDNLASRIEAMSAALELCVSVGQVQDAGSVSPRLRSLIEQLDTIVASFNSIKQEREAIGNDNQQVNAFLPVGIRKLNALIDLATKLDPQVISELAQHGVRVASGPDGWAELTQRARQASIELLGETSQGLVNVEADMDEAMLTALVQRLDLMNRRGEVADAWRDIKYAGDSLRGILDIEASQSIRTPATGNKPFDFGFDDSTTSLSLNFDTPLNRRAERNVFRLALINYNLALRNLQEAEDNVKLDVRDNMRSLELDRNQYDISIASAALAYERVVSTRLQLITPGSRSVSARDFLESQQAYTRSLSSVARQHIRFIIDRIEFFLDLEQLNVDELNYWPELNDEEYPFIPNANFAEAAPLPYDAIPNGPWYSRCMERLRHVAPGQAGVHTTVPKTENPAPESRAPKSGQPEGPVIDELPAPPEPVFP